MIKPLSSASVYVRRSIAAIVSSVLLVSFGQAAFLGYAATTEPVQPRIGKDCTAGRERALQSNQVDFLDSCDYVPTDTGCQEATTVNTTPATKSVAAFVDAYGKMAYDNSIKTGVPYEVTLAQAIVESGYGKSGLTTQANNFFGIKAGSSWTGPVISLPTREVINGKSITVQANFRKYASAQESFADHDLFLRKNSRYSAAFSYSKDPFAFIKEVAKAGYATDPNYTSTISNIIRSVQSYVASKNLFPPSSQVVYSLADPAPTGTAESTSITPTTNCPDGASGGSLGVSPDGFVFPLQTTKSVITSQSPVWCSTSQKNCHHDYNAADIFAPTGTTIVAAKPGTVVSTNYSSSFGQNVTIKGDDGLLYFYNHMPQGMNAVAVNAVVKAGDKVGEVGTDANANGSPHHLHFDISKGVSKRIACSAAECSKYNNTVFINVQPVLTAAFNGLQN